jgi:SAM-dependent methyltransferase
VVRNELLDVHAPGREEAYDVVCAFQTLEHVPDPSSFVRLCVQSLKKGGFLIYSVPSADSYVSMIPNAVPNLPPHHLSHWPDATLMKIAELFGLKVVAMEHEFLSDVHRVGYATTICFLALNDLLRRKPALVDVSFKGRMVIKIASLMGRFLGRGLRDPRVLPRGHSVTVVYGKGSAE